MHKKYIELMLLPDDEISLQLLWKRVFAQVHWALSTFGNANNGRITLGVSFPQYNFADVSLGHRLRIFALVAEDLHGLKLPHLLRDIQDYVHFSDIKDVPKNCGYVSFNRAVRRTAGCKSKLARRQVKRAQLKGIDISHEDALANYSDFTEKTQYPYINLVSNSSGMLFPLAIKSTPQITAKEGDFNSFGLSNSATVPAF